MWETEKPGETVAARGSSCRGRHHHHVGIRPGPAVYITFMAFSGLYAPSCPADSWILARLRQSPERSSGVGRRCSFGGPFLLQGCGNSGRRIEPRQVSRILRRSYLPVPDRRMFHGNGSRRRPRANRGENKARRDIHARAARSAENMVYGTTGYGCTYKNPRVSDSARCPYLDLIPRRDAPCEYISTSRSERRRNCLSEVAAIRGAPCRRHLQILYRGNLVCGINILNLPRERTNAIYSLLCARAIRRRYILI